MRKYLLITEFSCLAVLLASMAWLGNSSGGEAPPAATAWLLVPALASLGVFLSFLGLMYLRWVASSEQSGPRHKIVFALLTITLLSLWVYGIANTWSGLHSAA